MSPLDCTPSAYGRGSATSVTCRLACRGGSANQFLAKTARTLRIRVGPYTRYKIVNPHRLRKACEEHEEIVPAIRAGDSTRAGQAMCCHVEMIGSAFADFVPALPPSIRE